MLVRRATIGLSNRASTVGRGKRRRARRTRNRAILVVLRAAVACTLSLDGVWSDLPATWLAALAVLSGCNALLWWIRAEADGLPQRAHGLQARRTRSGLEPLGPSRQSSSKPSGLSTPAIIDHRTVVSPARVKMTASASPPEAIQTRNCPPRTDSRCPRFSTYTTARKSTSSPVSIRGMCSQ